MIADPAELGDFADQSELEALAVLAKYRQWIVELFAPYLGGRVVEYGAGIGSISAELLPRVAELDLVEPCQPLFEKLAAVFGGERRVRLFSSTIEASLRATPDSSYDGVVLVNVLEHIRDDAAALCELNRVLKPGGALCLFVPAHAALYSVFDLKVGHHRRYEMPALVELTKAAGFTIAEARYFDIIGVVPWLIVMRLFGITRINSFFAEIYDRFGVPLGRALERVISPPFGKNIILVARKAPQ